MITDEETMNVGTFIRYKYLNKDMICRGVICMDVLYNSWGIPSTSLSSKRVIWMPTPVRNPIRIV
jgi:hypothetical protein